MTIEEAIKVIKEDALYNPECAEICIEVLKKQIPKKYELNDSHWSGFEVISCPVCHHSFGAYVSNDKTDKEITIIATKVNYNFCPQCGQAIDFSEWGTE